MSFIDSEIFKAFVSDQHWTTRPKESNGFTEVLKQVDDIIFQKTGVSIPSAPEASTNKTLQNIECAIAIYFIAGKSGSIESDDRLRVNKLYDDAMAFLDKVKNGDEVIKDSAGLVISVSRKPVTVFYSNREITKL